VSRTDEPEPRLLAARSELGYVSYGGRALRAEPEAVDRETQQRLTLAARRRWTAEQRRAWGQAHRQISGALAEFEHSGPVDRGILHAAAAVERAAKRVDAKLELGG
jgi:hypothetical protein